MRAALTKAFAFFLKEIHDVRRQPRLLLSLVGGPLLVLAAFGATFRSANPFVSAVLVWPEGGLPGVDQQRAEAFIAQNFYLAAVTTDKAEALDMLDRGVVDVVQIIPDLASQDRPAETRPTIEVVSRAIDPTADGWIRSVAYAEMNFVNQQLLAQEAGLAQDKAREANVSLEAAQAEFEQLRASFSPEEIARATKAVEDTRALVRSFVALLPALTGERAEVAPELARVHREANLLLDDLDELAGVLREDNLPAQLERLTSAVDEIGALRASVTVFVDTPTERILSPVEETYTNLRGAPYSLVVFYMPAVLALLMQQLAITLGALGLVREQQMGAFEMFRVSPLRFAHILLGKSGAYVLYVVIAGAVLTGLLALLGAPMPAAHPGQFIALLLMLAVASTGIGLLISALSGTDSQAIQLTMLLLLLSVFFTGFFLPINGFQWPAWIIAFFLPMTHAIEGLQSLILRGEPVPSAVWFGLGLISLLSYGLVGLVMRRRYRRTTA
jgi:ABC-2 type transport system permease protein